MEQESIPSGQYRERLVTELKTEFDDLDAMILDLKHIDFDSLSIDTFEQLLQKMKDLRTALAANSMELQKVLKNKLFP